MGGTGGGGGGGRLAVGRETLSGDRASPNSPPGPTHPSPLLSDLTSLLVPNIHPHMHRGAMVALPAVGALFVAHLAHQDYERMLEEHGHGHGSSAFAFLTAFLCDAVGLQGGRKRKVLPLTGLDRYSECPPLRYGECRVVRGEVWGRCGGLGVCLPLGLPMRSELVRMSLTQAREIFDDARQLGAPLGPAPL